MSARSDDARLAFGPVSAAEHLAADRFLAALTGWRPHQRSPSLPAEIAGPLHQPPLLGGPLDESEWRAIVRWLSRRRVDTVPLTSDDERNARLVAAALFCARNSYLLTGEDPRLCRVEEITIADSRVQALVPHVTARGPIVDWPSRTRPARMAHAIRLLTTTYGYAVPAAAGLVGNLDVESMVLPQRVQGSAEATPMRARNFDGHWRTFTAEAVMRRSVAARTGPSQPGVGLAQWTRPARRAGLFAHVFRGVVLGPRVLFDFEAQIDYLVAELQSPGFHAVQAVLTGMGVTLEDASDAVVYDFEIPGSILDGNQRRPRTHPAVIEVFNRRRQRGQQALQAFQQPGP